MLLVLSLPPPVAEGDLRGHESRERPALKGVQLEPGRRHAARTSRGSNVMAAGFL